MYLNLFMVVVERFSRGENKNSAQILSVRSLFLTSFYLFTDSLAGLIPRFVSQRMIEGAWR